jgi:hypothetical protein
MDFLLGVFVSFFFWLGEKEQMGTRYTSPIVSIVFPKSPKIPKFFLKTPLLHLMCMPQLFPEESNNWGEYNTRRGSIFFFFLFFFWLNQVYTQKGHVPVMVI